MVEIATLQRRLTQRGQFRKCCLECLEHNTHADIEKETVGTVTVFKNYENNVVEIPG